jgi:hypothetical protein
MKKAQIVTVLLLFSFVSGSLYAKEPEYVDKKKDSFPEIKRKGKAFKRSKLSREAEAAEDADDQKSVAAPIEYVRIKVGYEHFYIRGGVTVVKSSDINAKNSKYYTIDWKYSYGFNLDAGYRFSRNYSFFVSGEILYTKLKDETFSYNGGGSTGQLGAGFRWTPIHIKDYKAFENLAFYLDVRGFFALINTALRRSDLTTNSYDKTYLYGKGYGVSIGAETFFKTNMFFYSQLGYSRYFYGTKDDKFKFKGDEALGDDWTNYAVKLYFGIGRAF